MPLCSQGAGDPYEGFEETIYQKLQPNNYISQHLIDIINKISQINKIFIDNYIGRYEPAQQAVSLAIRTRLDVNMFAAYKKVKKCMQIVSILLDISYAETKIFIALLDVILQIGQSSGKTFTADLAKNATILNRPECKNLLSAMKVLLVNLMPINTFLKEKNPFKDVTQYARFQPEKWYNDPVPEYEIYYKKPNLQYILHNMYQLIAFLIDSKYSITKLETFNFRNGEITEIADNQSELDETGNQEQLQGLKFTEATLEDLRSIAEITETTQGLSQQHTQIGKADAHMLEQRFYALISIAQCFMSKYQEDTVAGICIYQAHKSLVYCRQITFIDNANIGILNKNLHINLYSFFQALSNTPEVFKMLKGSFEDDEKLLYSSEALKQCRKNEAKIFMQK